MSIEDRKKDIWSKYKPHKADPEKKNMSTGIKCQDCNSTNAERSPLRGRTLCSHCKNEVWKSDTAGSNYDRFIGMGIPHDEAIQDSGYDF